MAGEALQRGDLVEVRSPAEILDTLDAAGALEMLPFMPEMAAYCGLRFRVDRRADRVCDTVNGTGTRTLKDSVYLEDLRCSGESHGGCQAECRYFWKEAWLRRVTADTPPARAFPDSERQALVARAMLGVQRQVSDGWQQRNPLALPGHRLAGGHDARQSLESAQLHRASSRRAMCRSSSFVRVMGRAAVLQPMHKLGLIPRVHLKGTREKPLIDPPLDLRPGELVQVKSKEEIAETLTKDGRNKGLWFDREMMVYCGRTFRVRRRVTRFINDQDGRMIELKTDCVTLDGCVCSGDHSLSRWFCGRAIYSYWRESWLRRVNPAQPHQLTRGPEVHWVET